MQHEGRACGPRDDSESHVEVHSRISPGCRLLPDGCRPVQLLIGRVFRVRHIEVTELRGYVDRFRFTGVEEGARCCFAGHLIGRGSGGGSARTSP